ncbi:GGDEF domain-containing protein [Aeromonas enteropelogenes]|uniref:diguanylate cyclase n=1 Tax=Aeromonas enteropelogenes TaxID=29489 RepID=A0ABU9JG79_AEREN|nr:sensor domain-containing diguanylate cyclase [Aeromonas enteropelogenes]UBH55097.1 sensor domain-containing diguanylate cyclase [Aeromonas enteropelogenes]UCA11676.1 sensor domain-containing diguanylate cyclase [Aeromonas enteropelogenes]
METLKTPLVDVTTRLDPGLLSDAMNLLEAGLWTWSVQQGLRRDPSCLHLLGLGDSWPDDMGWLDRVHPDDVSRLEEALLACQSGRSATLRLEYRILHHHGHYIRLEERIRRDERGHLLGAVRHLDSVEEPVEERHGTDPLTGLESRNSFELLLEDRLATDSGSFSLMQFSVDHMTKIQQLFGEAACDAMLAKLARIVRHELRREDPFARWDEDGFILMLSQTERASGLEIAERLRLEIADASLLPQRPVTVSVGLVQSQPGEMLDHLLARLASCHGQARREHNTVVG